MFAVYHLCKLILLPKHVDVIHAVNLLALYEKRFGLRFSAPTIFNITFTAGTTHLLAAVRHRTPKAREAAVAGVKECVHFLYLIGRSWPAARHKGEILQRLVDEYLLSDTLGMTALPLAGPPRPSWSPWTPHLSCLDLLMQSSLIIPRVKKSGWIKRNWTNSTSPPSVCFPLILWYDNIPQVNLVGRV